MSLIRNWTMVVLCLVIDMYMAAGIKQSVYDDRTVTRTKSGYYAFVFTAAFIAIGAVAWLGAKIY
ncbi:hypothetical protein FHS18_000968 [Paenibacillus phyllosphaerae]|uniref:Uncharacterized protein n=1 Tax=Paenibacillus phyllosphaerae TaxID=274593 RepID=A0A7W5AV95_9BACL|nr:hypothetical protein [Paenibacillus phyllosphaerae]MBB3108916.1 hypothetical protein [Paenibacillus phyllosphaerae]